PNDVLNLDDDAKAKEFRGFVNSLPGESDNQILGRTDGSHGDSKGLILQCQWGSNGLYSEGDGDPGFDVKRAKELEEWAWQWRLLLQLQPDENAVMFWVDCGMLYFWIRDEDLRQQDFSNVWVILEDL
ncbi:DUF1963 domain-containing protein, partial [Thermodesulfobacteriota bacterium]